MSATNTFDLEKVAEAKAGSHEAFKVLVKPYLPELRRHAYRMTASFDDADDVVQETLLRAWRKIDTYEPYGSFRGWLYRIATNKTLDLLRSAPKRRELVNSAGEPSWLQPFPQSELDPTGQEITELERIGLAFVVSLQVLPGRQRSALLLCDVLGFSPTEAAEVLAASVAATNSLLQRARATLTKEGSSDSLTAPDENQRGLVDRFTQAWQTADTKAMLALLDESAHLTMPPNTLEFTGPNAIVEILLDEIHFGVPYKLGIIPVTANGEAGLASYTAVGDGTAKRHCIMLFGGGTDVATKITGFTEDRVFDLLGLPTIVSEGEGHDL